MRGPGITLAALLPVLTTFGEFVVYDADLGPCPIVVPAGAKKNETKAAEALAIYLKLITGATFEIAERNGELPPRALCVGPIEPELLADLRITDLHLRASDQQLLLLGGSSAATLHAVYDFLERHCGCRWWSATEEDVPKLSRIAVPAQTWTLRAPFTMHYMMNREFQNKRNDFNAKCGGDGHESFTGSHSLYPLLTAYAKDHPEIYPQDKDGTRKANNLHFCYLAPGISEALAAVLAKQVEKRKGNVDYPIYFAGMGDWYGGMCLCDACQPVYQEETWTDPDGRSKPGYTATLLRMMNRTGEILEAQYPGIRIGTFAYMSLEAPPAKTRPRSNVVIRVPRLRHCTMHGADECDQNASYLRNLEQWCQITPAGVYIWDYGASFKDFLFPFPCLNSMARNIRLYHRLGIRGTMIQGNYVTTGSDLVVLKNYVWRRLMWEPQLETDAVLRAFCDGYYGPASDGMLAYVTALEDSVRKPEQIHADEFAGPGYLTPEARAQLILRRQEALAAAPDEPWRQRVAEGTAGIEALQLCGGGIRRDGKKPVPGPGGIPLWSKLPEYSWARAQALVRWVRDSGVNEWTTGFTHWNAFLHAHARLGSELLTLTDGDLQVIVAPGAVGQLRQISLNGQSLLAPTPKHGPLGGSQLHLGRYLGHQVGEATATSVRIEDGVIVPGWRWAQKFLPTIWQQVTLSGGRIVISAGSKEKTAPRPATITTTYPMPSAEAVSLACQTAADDAWQPLALVADELTILPALTRLRVATDAGTVVDRYLAPAVASATAIYRPDTATLTVEVTTAPVGNVPATEDSALLGAEPDSCLLRIIEPAAKAQP